MQQGNSRRTILVGAPTTGLGEVWNLIGFVDDNEATAGEAGLPYLGTAESLPDLAPKLRVEIVLVLLASCRGPRLLRLLCACAPLGLQFLGLPEDGARRSPRALQPGDLIARPEAVPPLPPLSLATRTALVTGAAGSIGSEICRQLLREGIGRLVLVDLDRTGLAVLGRRLANDHGPRTRVEVGDVRDLPRMRSLFARYRPRDVFHAAALKHVSLVEAAPCEAVKTNVSGTLNVAEAAAACEAERFVYISTDKAVLPASVMGATKRVGEELLRLRSRRNATAYCSVRFGNVLGSSGSVVEIFKKQIASGGPVTLTHPEVRRYFMGLSEAVSLVLYAAYGAIAELLVVDLNEQVRIADLATAMIVMAGLRPGHDVAVELIGLRPGEKLFETLLTEDEKRTRRIDHGLLAVDCPTPIANLGEVTGKLIDAANRDLDDRVIALLREAAPGYGRQDPAVAERKPSTLTPPGEPPTLDGP